MNLEKYQIWQCSVYVSDKDNLPKGADYPPRMAVIDKLESMGLNVIACSSGWGGGVSKIKLDTKFLVEDLFKQIEHGDEECRLWLKNKLNEYFNLQRTK